MKLSDREKFARELSALQRVLFEAWRVHLRARRTFALVRDGAKLATEHLRTPLAAALLAELERLSAEQDAATSSWSRVEGAVAEVGRLLGVDRTMPKPRRRRNG